MRGDTTPGEQLSEAYLEDALRVLGRDEATSEAVIAASAIVLADAERTAPDAPRVDRSRLMLAEGALRRQLARLTAAERNQVDLGGYLYVNLANALRLMGADRDGHARMAFDHALATNGAHGGWFLDAAICHKWRGRFVDALEATTRAKALLGDTRAVLWNEAIAATALGDGERALGVWRKLGLEGTVGKGGLPLIEGVPEAQVRVPTRGAGLGPGGRVAVPDDAVVFEVVAVHPLSPCHGVVVSSTIRDAVFDYGDVVLWDGAPVGIDTSVEPPRPRFPFLALLHRGAEERLRFIAFEQQEGAVRALASVLPENVRIDVHHERVEHACPRCAAGEAMSPHTHAPNEAHRIVHGKILCPDRATLPALRVALERALASKGAVELAIPSLYERLGETALAGKAHQRWGAMLRVGARQV